MLYLLNSHMKLYPKQPIKLDKNIFNNIYNKAIV